MDNTIYERIIAKRDFSKLPKRDVEVAFSHFAKRQTSDEEKIRLTRDLLRKVFSVFTSKKLLKMRDYDADWILKKHVSTRERLLHYEEIYHRILNDEKNVIDLGAGVNGFSYEYLEEVLQKGGEKLHSQARDIAKSDNKKTRGSSGVINSEKFMAKDERGKLLEKNEGKVRVNYIAVEATGQLVDLMNKYFDREKFDAKAIHRSLFDLSEIKKIIKSMRGKKIVFLFKVLDSLEMLERDYSKKLLKEIVPLADKVVVSFATRSLVARKKFKVNRNWIRGFIQDNFKILDEFELGEEKYIVFKK